MTEYLYIAEKPSLAKEIAGALGKKNGVTPNKTGGAWEVGNDKVCWLFGHMYEQANPQDYDPSYEAWRLDTLPIIPEKWRLKPSEDKKSHIKGIASHLKSTKYVVNAGDAAREGQLLVDELLIENNWDPFSDKTFRLWVRSVAMKDLLAAIDSLFPNKEKENLYWSAVCRQRADWMHGINMTRLYSIKAREAGASQTVSVGRVQTPTLKLVVDRDRIIKNFKPVDHYLPTGNFIHENGKFTANWVIPEDCPGLDPDGRLIDKAVAQQVVERIAGHQGKVASFSATDKKKAPPLPYALSSLQTECSAKLGLSAAKTLEVAQKLYETHKLTTYPRSDSKYLPLAILKDEAPSIMEALKEVSGDIGDVAKKANMSLKSAAWNDAKVSDHHGIIPTSTAKASKIESLDKTERAVFDLIAKAFIAQFFPDQRWKALSAEIHVDKERFKASGRKEIDAGWCEVYGKSVVEDDEDGSQSLPMMAKADPVTLEKGDISSKRTSPPSYFTDGTLIEAMTQVHKFVSDGEVKKRLKENDGLGTEATRANIIETLIKRNFIKREGKNKLVSTMTGQSVISVLPESVTDPGMTALWEGFLDQVNKGDISHEAFLNGQIKNLKQRIEAGKSANVVIKGAKTIKPLEGHGQECEKCGQGKMITREIQKGKHKGKKFLSCSSYPACEHVKWPEPDVKPMEGHGKECPTCKQGKMVTRKSAKGTVFLSCNRYPECKGSEFPKEKVKPIKGDGEPCSKCKTGKMVTRKVFKGANKGKTFLSCDQYPKCSNTVWPK